MDVRKIVKVYNYVHDERKPKVNLKFAAALAAFLLSGAALVGFVALQRNADAGAAVGPAAVGERRTDYVGLSTEEIASGRLDMRTVDQRWADWQAQHPDAQVEKREEVKVGAVVVGYKVTYREP